MAKKDLLKGFEFKKLDGLNNGIDIPISNSLKDTKIEKINEPISQIDKSSQNKANNKPIKAEKEPKVSTITLPRDFDFKGKGIEPMVNVVPTPQKVVYTAPKVVPTKSKVVPTNEDEVIPKKIRIAGHFNEVEYGALMTKQEQISYLANRGWSLRTETRRNTLYHYAIKYINRKKERIYIGSINNT
ncbi:MAG: hypothetical protein RL662_1149 [Bacteroidota bacterium]|jgi:hypothetical protein